MNIHESFLKSFIGGVFYFRFPCFETGPDFWHLFRSKLVDLELNQEGLFLATVNFNPNRFTLGEWIQHETDNQAVQEFRRGENHLFGPYPLFQLISPDTLYAKLSSSGEGIFYADKSVAPGNPFEVFRDFPQHYEADFGLGSITL